MAISYNNLEKYELAATLANKSKQLAQKNEYDDGVMRADQILSNIGKRKKIK